MEILNKEQLISNTVSRALNNAPVSEILRVYSLALQNEIAQMSDVDLFEALNSAGYTDLIEKHFPLESLEEVVLDAAEVTAAPVDVAVLTADLAG